MLAHLKMSLYAEFVELHCCFWQHSNASSSSIAHIADLRHFCILCTRPKSCFGGVNEQSGYLVLLLVPYSENLLLDRVASSSKKAQIFLNILFLDTDNKVFWFISFFLVTHFCKSAICVHLASCCFHFLWGFHERYQCLNFKTDSMAKINSKMIMMTGAKNENQHQTNGFHTLLEITR